MGWVVGKVQKKSTKGREGREKKKRGRMSEEGWDDEVARSRSSRRQAVVYIHKLLYVYAGGASGDWREGKKGLLKQTKTDHPPTAGAAAAT